MSFLQNVQKFSVVASEVDFLDSFVKDEAAALFVSNGITYTEIF